jgi:PncC family amidohydrolase
MRTLTLSKKTRCIVHRAHQALVNAHASVAVAESCTGGLVSFLLTDLPGSSSYFLEGVVVYSNAAKTRLLAIAPSVLRKHGAVSRVVARLLAQRIRQKSGADFGAGITGIAGPSGGLRNKPVGTVFIAVSSGSRTACSVYSFKGSRASIRLQASLACLHMLTTHANLRSDLTPRHR